ncbi:RNA polymerase sigma factor [Candidatus Magnetominusculus xianensis]|uniref:RNA polymerase, sigma-24 subunit, ECF subfamily n=1 Tax=Candidatus Magnetominusculus xianensis TaxID=1748249 RepID=A0ABR5SAK9_9BACT|nr:RNA polymerase sigma factor [Candidatus Magnetominusculus xianensis]KWT73746.1 RNA polymerase, sigma-24 subunit, ECF subfamily [Candidatus Magnetominusculus xianensis]MBF0405554.1 RNA polymerase sigma factor [Nitrospirota bacterium]
MDEDSRSEDYRLIDSYLDTGDEAALEALVVKYRKEVYLIAYRVAGDVEEAKDITQKAFISAVSELRNFKKNSAFKTWLYRITVNTALNHTRGSAYTVELCETIKSDAKDADTWLIEKQQERHLKTMLASLPPRQRISVILRVYKGLSIAETADVMGCSEGAVKSHYHSAINKLKAAMAALLQGKDL